MTRLIKALAADVSTSERVNESTFTGCVPIPAQAHSDADERARHGVIAQPTVTLSASVNAR